MSNVFDVKANDLLGVVAAKLKEANVEKPVYVDFVKTGAGRERVPLSRDFWYMRCASILRQAYINGPIGINRLRTRYGNSKGHTRHRHEHVRAGGSIIKDAFDALEKCGYIKKTKTGRVITPSGKSLLDKASKEILKESA